MLQTVLRIEGIKNKTLLYPFQACRKDREGQNGCRWDLRMVGELIQTFRNLQIHQLESGFPSQLSTTEKGRRAESEPEGESSVEREDKVLRKCHCRRGLLQATAIKLAPKTNLCVHAEGGFTLVSV